MAVPINRAAIFREKLNFSLIYFTFFYEKYIIKLQKNARYANEEN